MRYSVSTIVALVTGAALLTSLSVAAPPRPAPTPFVPQVPLNPATVGNPFFAHVWTFDKYLNQVVEADAHSNMAVWPDYYDLKPLPDRVQTSIHHEDHLHQHHTARRVKDGLSAS